MTIRHLRPDFEMRMVNWATWKLRDQDKRVALAGSGSISSIYRLAGQSRARFVYQGVIPVLALEALEVDRAMIGLPDRLRMAVSTRWRSSVTIEMQARVCGCSVAGYYKRLDRGHCELGARLHVAVYLPAPRTELITNNCGLSLNVA
jgi:hypothetical protein